MEEKRIHLDLTAKAPEGLNESKKIFKSKKRLFSVKRVLLSFVFLFFASVGWFGLRVYNTWSSIRDTSGGNLLLPAAITQDINRLRGEGDGRVNVLILGMGGQGHAGGTLADTIVVASVDPETGHTAMLSLPRDLYVPIPDTNRFSKINAIYFEGEKKGGQGPQLMKQAVANLLDITVHYYVKVDFAGFTKVVDTVGGVDVNVETALFDNSYPCDGLRGYCPFKLAKGEQHLDGKTALKYARCRKGTCGNDFGRAKRQQEVITKVGEKVRSSDTLTNPIKIDKLLASLGTSVRTDIGLKELEEFIKIAKKIDTNAVNSQVLSNEPNSFLVSGSAGGAYILKPKTGNFEKIQEFAHSIFTDPFIKKEDAKIALLNGSFTHGLAAQLSKKLKNYNYNIVKVADADRKDYRETIIVDYTNGEKKYTLKYLELRFGVKAIKETRGTDEDGLDIKVIVGNNFKTS